MLNPAWKPARRQSAELERIRDHFLEDDPPRETDEEAGLLRLPVLVTIGEEESAQAVHHFLDALQRQLDLPSGQGRPGRRWLLETGFQPSEKAPPYGLLIAHASLTGIREAYLRMKACPGPLPVNTGLLLTGTSDLYGARRYYRRLAVGLLRFLNAPLSNLGPLPVPGPDFGETLASIAYQIQHQSDEDHPLQRFRALRAL